MLQTIYAIAVALVAFASDPVAVNVRINDELVHGDASRSYSAMRELPDGNGSSCLSFAYYVVFTQWRVVVHSPAEPCRARAAWE